MSAKRFLQVCGVWMVMSLVASVAWSSILIKDADGYVITWAPGVIPMQVKLANAPLLSDDTSARGSVVAAMDAWNTKLGVVQFHGQQVEPGAYALGNRVNEIVMDSMIGDQSFGGNVLAVTVSYRNGNERVESDIIFNSAWSWDSYPGPLRDSEDIRRVALHELGHVLGLHHPDQAGQFVTAVMNSTVSDVDSLQTDDIGGAWELYGAKGIVQGNDRFANAFPFALGGGGMGEGSSIGATAESGEPAHSGVAARHSVWWKWTAPGNGAISVTTLGSNFDTTLSIYTGSALASLTKVAFNDDAESGVIRTSAVGLNVVNGTVYYLAVDGVEGAYGRIALRLELSPQPLRAPQVTEQPLSRNFGLYTHAAFTVAVSGFPAPTYQWQRSPAGSDLWSDLTDNESMAGTRTNWMRIASTQPTMNGDRFRCVLTNSEGSTTSSAAVLSLIPRSIIQEQPVGGEIYPGGAASLSIRFSDYGTVQWFRNGTLIRTEEGRSGFSSLSIPSASAQDAGSYHATFTIAQGYSAGTYTSDIATLTVTDTAKPFIYAQPFEGSIFPVATVGASSLSEMSYQWRLGGKDIPGATGATFELSDPASRPAGPYSVVVTNQHGSTVSREVYFSSAPDSLFENHPRSRRALPGAEVEFVASGWAVPSISYQWQMRPPGSPVWLNVPDSPPYEGALTTRLSVSCDLALDGYAYRCLMVNWSTFLPSQPAYLSVSNTPPTISDHPDGIRVIVPNDAIFQVTSGAGGGVLHQWQRQLVGSAGWTDLAEGGGFSGVTSASLRVSPTALAMDGDRYRCVVANAVGTAASNPATLTVSRADTVKFSAGRYHSARLTRDGDVHGTGSNTYGQLGVGNSTGLLTPRLALLPAGAVAEIAAGAQHTLALTAAKELWSVGFNGNGQLSNGTVVSHSIPMKVDTDVVAIAAAVFHSAYIKSDGTLWLVGGNDSGQLGDGTTIDRVVPVQVATRVVSVGLGNRQSLFLKSDGSLWGMGDMNGSGVPVVTPVQVASGVKAMAVGAYHHLFIKTDGTLWASGYNAQGQLGDGTTTTRMAPVQIATNVKAVAAGYFHSLFIKDDHSLWAMGVNGAGELGNGAMINRLQPVQITTNVAMVSASEGYTLFRKLDGSLWGTGYNAYGQFGNGNSTVTNSPVRLASGGFEVPASPRDLAVSFVADGGWVSLTWAPSADALSYEVWRSSVDDVATATCIAPAVRWSIFEEPAPPVGPVFYWVRALNPAGPGGFSPVVSSSRIVPLPVIVEQPVGRTVAAGGDVEFSVVAEGATHYQWRVGGKILPLVTGPVLALSAVTSANAGNYSVVVSNVAGTVTSEVARLQVGAGDYQAFREAYFNSVELLDSAISGPNADPDGDGLSNLLEYAFGSEPRTATTAATTSGLPEVAASASEWTYTYTRPSDRSDVTYAVEISTDLTTWTTTNVTHELVSTDAATGAQTWRARVPLAGGANVFFRLKATAATDQ